MVEFCEEGDGILIPSKDRNEKVLVYNTCGEIEPNDRKLLELNKFNTKIYHLPGEEFKNLELMKDWKKYSLN